MSNDPVLLKVLEPLARFYDDPATVEVRMTRPGRVITDRRGEGKRQHEAPDLNLAALETICKSLANSTGLTFDPDKTPKLSCQIPDVHHRFECLLGASVRTKVSLAIRCKHPFEPSWEQVGADETVRAYLEQAILSGVNMIVSGATNTGKTTLLNKMLALLPEDRRVIAAEDTPELEIDQFWDGVGLLAAREAARGGDESGMVDWRQLYDHCMRATPDHVLFGEISTTNSYGALGILNSGVTGFMCTIHAESPYQALHRKFEQNIAWSGQNMPKVPEFLCELIDVVIQIKRTTDGMRRITDIYEPRKDHWIMKDGETQSEEAMP